ncbi:DUF805 domain-containing protein [Vibrio splendidus]|nr:DUF805 domain-containing protein [Vibrio splendidus]
MTAIKRPIEFSGRSRRKEFWNYIFICTSATLILSIIDITVGWYDSIGDVGVLSGVFLWLTFLPFISVSVRRLHDINKSGYWATLYFLPIIGYIFILCLLLLDSDPNANRYGSPPRY